MKPVILSFLALLALTAGCHTPHRGHVERLLDAQAEAWNRGDVEAFMDGYWRSPELTFSSGGKTERGWDATLARYRAKYATRAQMGHLAFTDLEVHPLGPDAAYALGRWHLEREAPIGGNFTLVLAVVDGAWKILHDHTSVDAAP